MTKPYRPVPDEPCRQCPFRRASLPGWLGAQTPEGFIAAVMAEAPLPCHSTINYRRADWAERWAARRIGKLCRGALTFAANACKTPRPTSLLPVVPADPEGVFTTPAEFVAHHRSRRGSWEM